MGAVEVLEVVYVAVHLSDSVWSCLPCPTFLFSWHLINRLGELKQFIQKVNSSLLSASPVKLQVV